MVESFDVFDTVLTRAVGSPESVFFLLGKKLVDRAIISLAPDEFARLRVEAESLARRKRGGEVTLEEIYHELGAALGLSETHRLSMMRLECETEESLLRLVPHAVEKVSEARTRDGGVIFISDMYLPRSVIQGWLAKHGLWHEGDRIYLSNEAGYSKISGKLFELILAAERVPPEQLTHSGNHPHGDMKVPARIGIQLRPFPEGNLNRYEIILERHAVSTGGLSSLLAGASRLARLSSNPANENDKSLIEVSAGVLAPLLTGYVLWVLKRACELSLQRLYFLSRDGQILIQIAQRLASKLKIKIDLRYLYASRQSWHLPGITRVDAAKLEWMCMKYDFISIRSMLFRVNLLPDQVAEELAHAGFSIRDWDRQLKLGEIERIQTLLQGGAVHHLFLSQAAEKREILIGYLRQEGMLDGTPWALIDVGWNGRLQASLGEVLDTVAGPIPHGFYFGLASRPKAKNAGVCEAYLFDHSTPRYRIPPSRVNYPTLMEIACAGDHGTVVGFEEKNGKFEPILREKWNTPAIEWGLTAVQDAICRFADCLVLHANLSYTPQDLREASKELIRAFWENPTQLEAEAWGRFPFENDQSGTVFQPIAQAYGTKAVVRALFGRHMGKASVSSWQDGSIMISPPAIRAALKIGMCFKRFLRKSLQWMK